MHIIMDKFTKIGSGRPIGMSQECKINTASEYLIYETTIFCFLFLDQFENSAMQFKNTIIVYVLLKIIKLTKKPVQNLRSFCLALTSVFYSLVIIT
jgi:hypothetical protein